MSIGRGPTADYFLDSAVTLRLISRVHALIRGEKAVDGRPRFTITNNGLNGTYINDIKVLLATVFSDIQYLYQYVSTCGG